MTDWHLVHLFVPTLLPPLFLCVLHLFPLNKVEKARANPFVAVKDGQLSWAGLGMCVNALYELQHSGSRNVPSELWRANTFWITVALLIIHALIAATGPAFPTRKSGYSGLWHTIQHYRLFVASALLTMGAASLSAYIHSATQACAC